MVSAVVSMFFGGGLHKGTVALGLGAMVGLLVLLAGRSPSFALVLPAVAGIACAAGAQIAAHWVQPLFPSIPTLAGLIVLLPGLTNTHHRGQRDGAPSHRQRLGATRERARHLSSDRFRHGVG